MIVFYLGPRYGNTNVTVYAGLSAMIGSFAVVATKGLGIILKNTVNGNSNETFMWTAVVFIAFLISTAFLQLKYINKAIDMFNAAIILPFMYVTFTTFIMILTSILFKEWQGMSGVDIVGCVCGFLTILMAIFLLLVFSDLDVSVVDIKKFMQPKKTKKEDFELDNKGFDSSVSCSHTM